MSNKLKYISKCLEDDVGFILLRGLDSKKYSLEQVKMIYLLIGSHIGRVLPQNREGDLVHDVINTDEKKVDDEGIYVEKLKFHTDRCDVVSLLSLNSAIAGGKSRIVSSKLIFEHIKIIRPELSKVLMQNYRYKRSEWEGFPKESYYEMPICSFSEGFFSSWYNRYFLDKNKSYFSSLQLEALDLLNKMCEDPRFFVEFYLNDGDILFINNHLVYHGRSAYLDSHAESEKRKLLRLWLSPKNSRPLDTSYSPIFGKTGAGELRGGFTAM